MPALGRARVESHEYPSSPDVDSEGSTRGEESIGDDIDSDVGSSHEKTFEEQEEARKGGGRQGRFKSFQDDSRSMPLKVKRASKNEPQMLSSKRHTDPRFAKLRGGEANPIFRKQYAFLYDEELPREKQDIKKTLKKARKAETRESLQAEMTRLQQKLSAERSRRERDAWEAQQKAQMVSAVKQGQKPFYPKRSEKARQELLQRYKMLQETGKLDKVIKKKAKKNAVKDQRYVPPSRRA